MKKVKVISNLKELINNITGTNEEEYAYMLFQQWSDRKKGKITYYHIDGDSYIHDDLMYKPVFDLIVEHYTNTSKHAKVIIDTDFYTTNNSVYAITIKFDDGFDFTFYDQLSNLDIMLEYLDDCN